MTLLSPGGLLEVIMKKLSLLAVSVWLLALPGATTAKPGNRCRLSIWCCHQIGTRLGPAKALSFTLMFTVLGQSYTVPRDGPRIIPGRGAARYSNLLKFMHSLSARPDRFPKPPPGLATVVGGCRGCAEG